MPLDCLRGLNCALLLCQGAGRERWFGLKLLSRVEHSESIWKGASCFQTLTPWRRSLQMIYGTLARETKSPWHVWGGQVSTLRRRFLRALSRRDWNLLSCICRGDVTRAFDPSWHLSGHVLTLQPNRDRIEKASYLSRNGGQFWSYKVTWLKYDMKESHITKYLQ